MVCKHNLDFCQYKTDNFFNFLNYIFRPLTERLHREIASLNKLLHWLDYIEHEELALLVYEELAMLAMKNALWAYMKTRWREKEERLPKGRRK